MIVRARIRIGVRVRVRIRIRVRGRSPDLITNNSHTRDLTATG